MRGRYAEALVAAAGPVSNVLLALLSLTALGLWFRYDDDVLPRGTPAGNLQFLLWVFGFVNVSLALFNMIPIPPLDGSRILENFSDGYRKIAETLSATRRVDHDLHRRVLGRRQGHPARRRNAGQAWLELVCGFALRLVIAASAVTPRR